MHPVREILWTAAMAYTGFLLTDQGLRTFNSLSIMEASLGALTGVLLAIMFTLRERRRQRSALVTYSVEQIFPNWGTPRRKRRLTAEAKALIQRQAVRAARAYRRSLVQVNLMLLIRPRGRLRRMTTINLPMLVTDFPVCFTSIVETPFFYDSNLQIPQSDFRAIPATCLVHDSSQVGLDHVFCCLDLCCDLCIRAS